MTVCVSVVPLLSLYTSYRYPHASGNDSNTNTHWDIIYKDIAIEY